mgnify:CR=1 FL=1
MAVLQNAFANSFVVADPVEDHRQPHLHPAAAAVAARSLRAPTCWARWCAASSSGCGVFAVTLCFNAGAARRCRIRCGRSRSRSLGSAILGTLGLIAGIWADKFDQLAGVPEFRHHAAHVPVRRLLLDPFAAAVLAGAVALEPVLLYDRRLPLRILRRFGRVRRGQLRASSWCCCVRCRLPLRWRCSRAAGNCATERTLTHR